MPYLIMFAANLPARPRGNLRAVMTPRSRLSLMLPALLAACQPLPHPFRDDRPPAALLRIRDSAGVSIQPIVGEPTAVAKKLGDALASALLKHDIPASDRTTSLASYLLYGRVAQSRPQDAEATVTALWRLYDAKGHKVGERDAKLAASAQDWQTADDKVVAQLAGLSADGLASLLEDAAPVAAAAPQLDNRISVAIDKIAGAPGDGATALANAVAAVLQRQDLAIVAAGGKADLYLDAEVTVSPVKADKQHVKILWRVHRADGAQIGTVGQENDVPKGLLDGAWGDLAYSVAIAADDGLMQLVTRGAPARHS
jgi:hypothetical protein